MIAPGDDRRRRPNDWTKNFRGESSPHRVEAARVAAPASQATPQSMIAVASASQLRASRVRLELREDDGRTWLLTVVLTDEEPRGERSAFDIPSASSCRISRSRPVSISSRASPRTRHQGRVDEAVTGDHLVDRLQQSLVRRFLEDVTLGADSRPRPSRPALPL